MEIRLLRDLTRYRTDLVRSRTAEKQRVEKLLEDAQIKLSVVASDIFGVSGREMMAALIAGERDPKALAQLARARMRAKIPLLEEAFVGHFTNHHRFLLGRMLARVDQTSADIVAVEARIEELILPFARSVDQLDEITGVGVTAAHVLVAESGRRGALLRRAPLRTVHATRRRTRLKQAARALRVVVLASCVCGLGARAGRRRVSSGFGSCPACRARHGGRGSRRRLPAGPRSATSVPIPVGTGAAGRW
jgi:hypothetical protein